MQHPVDAADFDRAVRTVDRMLQGASAATATLYRLADQPALEAFAHGLLPDGRLVMVLSGADGMAGSADARIDLELQAPEPELRIVAASAHMLVRLGFVASDELQGLPESVAEAASLPGVGVAVATVETVLVHDPVGVSRITAADLRDAQQSVHETQDLAWGIDRGGLASIALEILTGLRPGRVLSARPLPGHCGGATGRAFVVDADAERVTTMLVGSGSATVIDVPAAELIAAGDLAQAAR